jgi:hypothetical protein
VPLFAQRIHIFAVTKAVAAIKRPPGAGDNLEYIHASQIKIEIKVEAEIEFKVEAEVNGIIN